MQIVSTSPTSTQSIPIVQTPLTAQDIARETQAFLRSQERDRMNERGQLWTIFISLASGFGFIATQGGAMAYLLLLFPVLIAFLAMHIRNSEDTLKQIRKYLYRQEQAVGYQGYEHFVRAPENTRTSHGGYKKALRGAFCTTGTLALGGVVLHMVLSHVVLLIIVPVFFIETAVIVFTWYELSNRKKHKQAKGA
jgi:4-hydroxybenzoate polyprenyltransferase